MMGMMMEGRKMAGEGGGNRCVSSGRGVLGDGMR